MKQINTGDPFDCMYCKKQGEFSNYQQIRKYIKTNETEGKEMISDKRQTRQANHYASLIPFVFQDGSIRELYTRAIVKFNQEEVIL